MAMSTMSAVRQTKPETPRIPGASLEPTVPGDRPVEETFGTDINLRA
jgi:hypothetical protein